LAERLHHVVGFVGGALGQGKSFQTVTCIPAVPEAAMSRRARAGSGARHLPSATACRV
jgi:hypothetical protein